MFDIALTEAIMVALLALIIIRPEDLPSALRAVGRALGKLRDWSQDWARMLDPDSPKKEGKTNNIVGDDGQDYECYDVSELSPFLGDAPQVQADTPPETEKKQAD